MMTGDWHFLYSGGSTYNRMKDPNGSRFQLALQYVKNILEDLIPQEHMENTIFSIWIQTYANFEKRFRQYCFIFVLGWLI